MLSGKDQDMLLMRLTLSCEPAGSGRFARQIDTTHSYSVQLLHNFEQMNTFHLLKFAYLIRLVFWLSILITAAIDLSPVAAHNC